MAEPASSKKARTSTTVAISVVFAAALAVAFIAFPGVRNWFEDIVDHIRQVPPFYLILFLALKIAQSLFSAMTWWNILRATYPGRKIPYKLAFGADQVQDLLNLAAPARAGSWVMLGLFRLTIPGATIAALLTVWGVQNIAFALFAFINYTVLLLGLPDIVDTRANVIDWVRDGFADYPALAWGAVLVLLGSAGLLANYFRPKLEQYGRQIKQGAAILGTPQRYVDLVFLPSLVSYLLRCAGNAVLLFSFDIPVTFWTVALSVGARSLSGAVRVTPGGLGVSQAIDVVALQRYASSSVVTAYSLSEAAISLVSNTVVAVVALIWAFGWRGAGDLVRRRNAIAADTQAAAGNDSSR